MEHLAMTGTIKTHPTMIEHPNMNDLTSEGIKGITSSRGTTKTQSARRRRRLLESARTCTMTSKS